MIATGFPGDSPLRRDKSNFGGCVMNQLSDLINVAPRYARSVNLERDGFTDAAVEGYVVTATAEEFCDGSGGLLPEPEATVPGH